MFSNILIGLLPAQIREMIVLAQRIFSQLDTKEERDEVLEYAKEMFEDGKVTVPEWGKFGGKLGILKQPTAKKKKK
jgi:predicted urease superfamily metal-dependent hydrolase